MFAKILRHSFLTTVETGKAKVQLPSECYLGRACFLFIQACVFAILQGVEGTRNLFVAVLSGYRSYLEDSITLHIQDLIACLPRMLVQYEFWKTGQPLDMASSQHSTECSETIRTKTTHFPEGPDYGRTLVTGLCAVRRNHWGSQMLKLFPNGHHVLKWTR